MIIKRLLLILLAINLTDGVIIAKSKIITPFDKSDPFTLGLGKGQSETPSTGDVFLLETGDNLLMETDDKFLME